tara:strand:- start:847 stop:1182 length:336 start_codon:yes stop_codon:yes gene_type:complete
MFRFFKNKPKKNNIIIEELKFQPYSNDYYDESNIFKFAGYIINKSDFDIENLSFTIITTNQFNSKNIIHIKSLPCNKRIRFDYTSSTYCDNYNTNMKSLKFYIDNLKFYYS